MVQSAALLFRERGLTATGFREVATHSGVSRGSISHHFPGGKAELVRDAVQWSGAQVSGQLEHALQGGNPVRAVRDFIEVWRASVVESDAKAGCTVATVATETLDPELLAVTADIFRSWQEPLHRALHAAGVAPSRARRLAMTLIAALEGALVLCRAERSPKPLVDVGQELEALVIGALP
ncbi:MAG TPA: TetR/AcrR family transcriptional regulator [Myxococcaceae bacterium]|nr:TetR/AcrR family transcriptional regulator [Myxococcaceae bacterium]